MNQVPKVKASIWWFFLTSDFGTLFSDNLNIENVFMGVVNKILADMPLEAPIPSAGLIDPSDDTQPQQSSCSCWFSNKRKFRLVQLFRFTCKSTHAHLLFISKVSVPFFCRFLACFWQIFVRFFARKLKFISPFLDMDIGQIIKIPKIENVSLLDAQLRVDCKGILMTNPHDFRYVSDKVISYLWKRDVKT